MIVSSDKDVKTLERHSDMEKRDCLVVYYENESGETKSKVFSPNEKFDGAIEFFNNNPNYKFLGCKSISRKMYGQYRTLESIEELKEVLKYLERDIKQNNKLEDVLVTIHQRRIISCASRVGNNLEYFREEE